MPLNKAIKKVLVIGSGPIVIGQAAEFDYSGTQACRVLKDAGLNVVLVNSNPATIMTDTAMADEIYLEPLTEDTIKRIIEKERPDSLLASMGGQTGLTTAMKLSKSGFLDKMGVKLIGTNAEADAEWNAAHYGGTKSIEITSADVDVRATFFCDLIDTTTRLSLLG